MNKWWKDGQKEERMHDELTSKRKKGWMKKIYDKGIKERMN